MEQGTEQQEVENNSKEGINRIIKKPIGLLPRKIHEEYANVERFNELCGAISRYYNSGLKINTDWIDEYNMLIEIIPLTKNISQEKSDIELLNQSVNAIIERTMIDEVSIYSLLQKYDDGRPDKVWSIGDKTTDGIIVGFKNDGFGNYWYALTDTPSEWQKEQGMKNGWAWIFQLKEAI